MENLKWRWVVVLLVTALGLLWISPNVVDLPKDWSLAKNKLILGLDIRGGLHLVMGVDTDSVMKERTERTVKNLEADMRDRGIPFKTLTLVGDDRDKMELVFEGEASRQRIEKYINDFYGTTLQVVETQADRLMIQFYDAYILESRTQVLNQSIEVIRNRIDEFGVAEASITAQGTDRILVQLPGIQESEVQRAKDLINSTATLVFRKVVDTVNGEQLSAWITEAETAGKYALGKNTQEEGIEGLTYRNYIKRLNKDLEGKLPKNSYVLFEKLENAKTLEAGRRPYVIGTESKLSGDDLEDASVGVDEFGKPQVNFRFSVEGRKLFAELTERATGGSIAAALDEVIVSVATVREKIDSDGARITLGAGTYQESFDQAQYIALALRAGALPAALEQLEERTVGPSLGADSIKKGQRGTLVAAVLVLSFILFYYGVLGIIASFAIILNLVFVFAGLSSLGATLTLPGVAGLALTIGMAVDANIIIYERIREELRKGSSQLAAMRDGFGHALSAILDANITTLLTCFILMYYGTGPVRGFAVSLAIGIVASVFTSIFVARTLAETFVLKFNLRLMKEKVA